MQKQERTYLVWDWEYTECSAGIEEDIVHFNVLIQIVSPMLFSGDLVDCIPEIGAS
jgi:hypothetical protein